MEELGFGGGDCLGELRIEARLICGVLSGRVVLLCFGGGVFVVVLVVIL